MSFPFSRRQLLTNVLKDAKRHQRTLVVILLNQRNAFGQVHKNVHRALKIHHVPEKFIKVILRKYIPSQVNFDLQIYDISLTWISETLDS